jgi:hypothetical protein
MKSYMKHIKDDVFIKVLQYGDGHTCLRLVTDSGEPIVNATTNLNEGILDTPTTVAIKGYSENEGVYETLVHGKIISESVAQYTGQFVNIPICYVIDEDVIRQIGELT